MSAIGKQNLDVVRENTMIFERATNDLLSSPRKNEYLEVNLDIQKQEKATQYVHDLAQKCGQKELGFGRKIPSTLKPMLK